MARSRLTSGKRAKLGWGRSLRALPPGPWPTPDCCSRPQHRDTGGRCRPRVSSAPSSAVNFSGRAPAPVLDLATA